MADGFERLTPQDVKKVKNGNVTESQTCGASYTLQADQEGRYYYHHPHEGRVRLVALFCNCGRSVLVEPKEVKSRSIICNLCDSAFIWQQLTFALE